MTHLQGILFAIVVAAVGAAGNCLALPLAGSCGGDCASCHSLSLPEARGLLKELGTVQAVKPAAVRGLYEITVERGGKTAVAYLDYGKQHIIAGQVYDVATLKAAGAPVAANRSDRLDPATLSIEHSLVLGNPKGRKRLFVFTDPECPYCAKMHVELKKLVGLEPDLAVYVKLLPLKMHPHAYDKARVILGHNSLDMLEKSFAGEALFAPGKHDTGKPIDETMRYAESVGINATPTLVLPDGTILPGLKDAESIRRLLK